MATPVQLPADCKIIFVLGAPGAGKGTRCARIVSEFNNGWKHLSTGDLLRAEVAAGTELGRRVEEVVRSGGMVSSILICDLLVSAMLTSSSSGVNNRFLVDGFPRNVDQLKEFETKVRPADYVLVFTLPVEVAVRRLLKRGETSGRLDDNENTIRSRMQVFMSESQPVIDALKGMGHSRVVEIDSQEGVDAVYGHVRHVIAGIEGITLPDAAPPVQQERAAAPTQEEAAPPVHGGTAPLVLPPLQGQAAPPVHGVAAPPVHSQAAIPVHGVVAPPLHGQAAPSVQGEVPAGLPKEAAAPAGAEAAHMEQGLPGKMTLREYPQPQVFPPGADLS